MDRDPEVAHLKNDWIEKNWFTVGYHKISGRKPVFGWLIFFDNQFNPIGNP